MGKIKSIFENRLLYKKLKQIFLFLVDAFRNSFVYKLFFRNIDDNSYNKSFFGRIGSFFKKGLLWIYEVLENVWLVKIINKIFKYDYSRITGGSLALKSLGFSTYRFSASFLICLFTLLVAGILPTKVVAGLVVISGLLIFTDRDFKESLSDFRFSVSDMLIFFYMIAIFHARNVSSDIQRNEIFVIYTVFIGAYFIFRYYFTSLSKVKMAISAFSCSGLFVCGVGFIQFITGSYKTTKWTDTNLFSDIQGRLVATFENPNVLGEYLLLLIPLVVAMFILTDRKLWKLIYGGIFLASILCMVLTYSRGCWVGLIVGMLLFILMLYPRLLIPIGILVPFSIFFIPQSIITRIMSIGNLQDGSSAFRVYLWRGTVNLIKNIWPYGIGLGNTAFSESYRPYAYEAVIAPHSHNTFLHVMCESGIFGFIVFILLLYFILRQLFVSYKEAETKSVKILSTSIICAVISLMVQAMFDNTMYNYRMYMMFFAILAISSSLYMIRREKND